MLLKFFTTWSVLMVVFHNQLFKYVNLMYVTFITLIVGLYLSFINPRKFVFYLQGERFVYTGFEKFVICDMLFHVFVFWFIWSRYRGYYPKFDNTLLIAISLFIIYVSLIDIKKTYGITLWEMSFAFALANLLYFFLL